MRSRIPTFSDGVTSSTEQSSSTESSTATSESGEEGQESDATPQRPRTPPKPKKPTKKTTKPKPKVTEVRTGRIKVWVPPSERYTSTVSSTISVRFAEITNPCFHLSLGSGWPRSTRNSRASGRSRFPSHLPGALFRSCPRRVPSESHLSSTLALSSSLRSAIPPD